MDAEPAEAFGIDPHDLSDALDSLGRRTGITRDDMAQLEFRFIHLLDGIPNLEQAIVDSPNLFAQAISLVYRRNDERPDPDQRLEDSEREHAAAFNAHALLKRLRRVPGNTADGTVDADVLARWCGDVRRQCSELGRAQVGDMHVGELLSHAPTDAEGRWPCGPVCEVMERMASRHVEDGFETAVFNARGPQWRGMEEGGDQERERSLELDRLSQRIAFDYPRVSGVLKRIAKLYQRVGAWEDSDAELRKRLV